MPPSIFQQLQLASLIARGWFDQARTYMQNQTRQGGTDWRGCPVAARLAEGAA